MRVLFGYDDVFVGHDAGIGHPERPERLRAVIDGAADADLSSDLVLFSPRDASAEELLRVHPIEHVDEVARASAEANALDPDTQVSPGSFAAALAGAGAGPDAIERLRRGEAESAFLAVRPPGHHARRNEAMGFCLFNNVAVAAAALVAQGERVLIVDWDAHHGNGTQEIFYESGEVFYVSLHQYPFYPGTGSIAERGDGRGTNSTLNLPLPAGTGGDAYRRAVDEAIVPAAELFSPSWLIVSCGFDAHRDDPLTDLGLSAGDFADLTERVMGLGAPGRRLFFLEGGYDLSALRRCAAVTLAGLAGERLLLERPTSGPLPGTVQMGGPTAPEAVISAVASRLIEEGLGGAGF